MSTSTPASQPNPTLYINNLNDQVNKDELKTQLYALFTTYGKIIDVVASKSKRMRGQAFLVFADLAGATTAMRACDGMLFYDKPLHIAYAKSKSYATSRKEDPSFVPPTSVNASAFLRDKKRQREEAAEEERNAKRDKADNDDDEEMEIEDDEDQQQQNAAASGEVPVPYPTARLLCTNLPQEVSDGVLSVLFQQYHGFKSTKVVPTEVPNVKKAQVFFDSPQLAAVAKEGLHGFTLKKDWLMAVQYI
ncbi:Spliceosomal protein [Mycena indigotica]|uniref:Spliceosomal protein n=1 Tax=Mycena indigotica TaxID=2126181 RepID=A0A8H6SLP4_9AGAR|nr:Spliceosomal protein [Mycena indigotica]KAF7301313.1 Spliceosomal protein [Mycena indigotica]